MTANPMVTLNRAVATAMVNGPRACLALVDGLGVRLGDHLRLHAVRAHLLEQAGAVEAAADEFRAAAARPGNLRERHYPATQAARLTAEPGPPGKLAIDNVSSHWSRGAEHVGVLAHHIAT